MSADDLSYSVTAIGDNPLPQMAITCEADAHLFIDTALDTALGNGNCPGLTVLSNGQCVCPASVTSADGAAYDRCILDQCECPEWGPLGHYYCMTNCPSGS